MSNVKKADKHLSQLVAMLKKGEVSISELDPLHMRYILLELGIK